MANDQMKAAWERNKVTLWRRSSEVLTMLVKCNIVPTQINPGAMGDAVAISAITLPNHNYFSISCKLDSFVVWHATAKYPMQKKEFVDVHDAVAYVMQYA